MDIQLRGIDGLTLDPANARKHSARNIAAISESLSRFGQRRPAVIRSDGTVLAGNGMVEAARGLGWSEVAVTVVPDGWSPEEARAYALADNRTAELAEWDQDVLRSHLVELEVAGWDVDALGFDVPEVLPSEVVEDKVPAVPDEPVTRLGDVWQVGPHRVICGDSSDPAVLALVTGNKRADAIVTDPPYGIGASKMTLGTGKKQFHRGRDWDSSRPSVAWLTTESDLIIIWGGNYFADELPVSNDWLCWHKKNDGLSFSEFELAWTNIGNNCRIISHHWSGEQKDHPTQKPLPVMRWCIGMLGGATTVLDPFAGSGTTLVAAAMERKVSYGVELDPAYVDVIVARLERETGETAVRVDG